MEPLTSQAVPAKEPESLVTSEDDDVVFLKKSAEELDEFEREETALNTPGNKRKRENNEEEINFTQKRKCDANEYVMSLLCITVDKLSKIEYSELQLRRYVLISNLEKKIDKALDCEL